MSSSHLENVGVRWQDSFLRGGPSASTMEGYLGHGWWALPDCGSPGKPQGTLVGESDNFCKIPSACKCVCCGFFLCRKRLWVISVVLRPERTPEARMGSLPLEVLGAGLSAPWAFAGRERAERSGRDAEGNFGFTLTRRDRQQPTIGVVHAVNKNTFPLSRSHQLADCSVPPAFKESVRHHPSSPTKV